MKASHVFALFLAAALVAPATAKVPVRPAPSAVTAVTRVLVAQASQNFAALRGAKLDYDTDFVKYKVKPIGNQCSKCKMYDLYARGTYVENWYVEDRWTVPSTWSPEKIETSIRSQLAPLLAGFSLHRTVSQYSKYPTLLYHGPKNVWINAQAYEGGFLLRIGHDLKKPQHVLRPPTQAQLTQLRDGSANLVRLSVPAAATNFEDLRSPTSTGNVLGYDTYLTNVSFGPMFRKCDVENINNGFGFKDFQPKWVLSCVTIAMAATDAALKETLHTAIEGALPSGFTANTNESDLLFDDYRWDDGDLSVSVDLMPTEDNGSLKYTLEVFHYLPKPDSP